MLRTAVGEACGETIGNAPEGAKVSGLLLARGLAAVLLGFGEIGSARLAAHRPWSGMHGLRGCCCGGRTGWLSQSLQWPRKDRRSHMAAGFAVPRGQERLRSRPLPRGVRVRQRCAVGGSLRFGPGDLREAVRRLFRGRLPARPASPDAASRQFQLGTPSILADRAQTGCCCRGLEDGLPWQGCLRLCELFGFRRPAGGTPRHGSVARHQLLGCCWDDWRSKGQTAIRGRSSSSLARPFCLHGRLQRGHFGGQRGHLGRGLAARAVDRRGV
mmetsp:Transcript_143713/g.459903  ORF Transcript_143713/g.459903 Transcript_143713/m.459903 type:complete len:271 (+) Transcript_143713:812-1624(+)